MKRAVKEEWVNESHSCSTPRKSKENEEDKSNERLRVEV
jgi:hypothetical protein